MAAKCSLHLTPIFIMGISFVSATDRLRMWKWKISNDLFQRIIQNIFPSARKRKRENIQLLSHQFLNSLPIISPVNFTVTGKVPNIHHFTKPVRKFLALTNILFGLTTKKTIAHLLVLLLRFTTRNSTGRCFFSTSTHLFVRSLSQ